MEPNNIRACPSCKRQTRVVCFHNNKVWEVGQPKPDDPIPVTCPACCGFKDHGRK